MAEDPLDQLMSATLAVEGEEPRTQRPVLPFGGQQRSPEWFQEPPADVRHQLDGTPWATPPGMPPAPSVVAPPEQVRPAIVAQAIGVRPLLGAPSAMPAIVASALGSPPAIPVAPPPRVSDEAINRGAASSAFAASNAARAGEPVVNAKATASPQGRVETVRERVDYLWHDVAAEADIVRTHPPTHGQTDKIVDEWVTPQAVTRGTKELAQIRRALQSTAPKSFDEVARLYEDSLDAGVDRMLSLVSGELVLSFDAVEALKVTLSVVTPFLTTDNPLKHAYEAAHEALKTTGGLAPSIASSHKDRVDEALRQTLRAASASLEATIERALLEGRSFTRRRVFGGSLVRGALHAVGGVRGRDATQVVPCYLTDAAAEQLPLMKSLPVRLVVEVRPSQDAVEAHPLAFRVVAIAREVSLARRG